MPRNILAWAAPAFLLGLGAAAQPAPHAAHGGAPFQVEDWANLADSNSLIREAHPSALDLAARDNETYITVYARKHPVQTGPGLGRRVDGDEAGYSEAATPWTLPVVPPTNCSNSAYQTIGGQPATGADLGSGLAHGC